MAVGIHVAHIGFFTFKSDNTTIVNKNSATATLRDSLDTVSRPAVIPDTAIPNTAGYPTVKRYLELEALTDYIVYHLDQTMVVTYDQGAANSAT